MKYSAFISYNHRDRAWARWLHRALETYRVPAKLVGRAGRHGPIADRLKPVFRDRDELAASADLAESVREALAQAESLIVICSPHAVRSQWVNEEIRSFRAMGRGDSIFCLIAWGEPFAADPAQECLPPALLEEGAREPLAADARKGQDGRQGARLKLIASMLGLGYDELRQREIVRRNRRLSLLATASMAGFVVTAGLAITAYLARNEAVEQRDIARQKSITAERTVDFITDMFQLADPSEAKGSKITVREIVDQAAGQYRQQLSGEPEVRAQIGLTLGEVYGALGLYRQSDRLVREVGRFDAQGGSSVARQALLAAESTYRLGNYEAAATQFDRAVRLARGEDSVRDALLSRALAGLGATYSELGRSDDASRVLGEAIRRDEGRGVAGRRDLAHDLEALGVNHFYGGDLKRARPLIERANQIRLETEGPLSPSVSDNLNTLAGIAYFEGRSAEAERLYLSRLAIDEKVLGPRHPDVASTLNNIGRIRLERRDYAQAGAMLARAVDIALAERGAEHDDMAFMMSNLAITRAARGQEDSAERLFRQALQAAERHGHRLVGPIRTDLAALRCRRGGQGEGLALLDAAAPVIGQAYPDDAWRIALVDNVRAECLWRSGKRADGIALFRRSEGAIAKRWPIPTHYGAQLRERARLIGVAAEKR